MLFKSIKYFVYGISGVLWSLLSFLIFTNYHIYNGIDFGVVRSYGYELLYIGTIFLTVSFCIVIYELQKHLKLKHNVKQYLKTDLIEKYLGKIIARSLGDDNERWILVTSIDEDGKYGCPTVNGKLLKEHRGFSTEIGSEVWSYVDNISRIVSEIEYSKHKQQLVK